MHKAIFNIIIAYVLLKQGYIGFLSNPLSPFASMFSSPFCILVMSVFQQGDHLNLFLCVLLGGFAKFLVNPYYEPLLWFMI